MLEKCLRQQTVSCSPQLCRPSAGGEQAPVCAAQILACPFTAPSPRGAAQSAAAGRARRSAQTPPARRTSSYPWGLHKEGTERLRTEREDGFIAVWRIREAPHSLQASSQLQAQASGSLTAGVHAQAAAGRSVRLCRRPHDACKVGAPAVQGQHGAGATHAQGACEGKEEGECVCG